MSTTKKTPKNQHTLIETEKLEEQVRISSAIDDTSMHTHTKGGISLPFEQEQIRDQEMEEHIAYWKAYLFTMPTELKLPVDYPRSVHTNNEEAIYTWTLPQSLVSTLRAYCRLRDVTLSALFLTGFQVLLHFYTNQDEFFIGVHSPTDRSLQSEQQAPFSNNVYPLRTLFTENPTIQSLFERTHQELIQTTRYQDIPFTHVLKKLKTEHNLVCPSPFQVQFAFSESLRSTPTALRIIPSAEDSRAVPGDLALQFIDQGENIIGQMSYNQALFDSTTIARQTEQLQILLAAMVNALTQPLAALPLLTEEEHQQIVIEWNHTAKAYPNDLCLHQLIEAQIERTPERPALIFEHRQLSYRELNEHANQLARYLRKLGVGPEVLVGVSMERSIEMVVALLAVLKAGGAYVPLDPTYPSERITFMLEDIAQSEHQQQLILLTQAHLADTLIADNRHIICLDTEWEIIAQEDSGNLPTIAQPGNAAYVIYTSGSTGKPKGVINTHRGICNRLLWMQDAYQLTEQDCVLQKTPFSFDVSVWEFFWPMMAGARLVVARPEGHKDSAYLVSLIQEQQITTLHFVPSMLQVFVMEPGLEQCTSLRQVMCSGEALPYELQESFFARHGAALHNLYGPTEAAIDATYWECQRNNQRHIVPIGYPIANTQIYILNRYGQPVPVGVPGELHIGGIGVARGYLNRAELTNERFIANPFSQDANARLYRTGDLARYTPGGEIAYLGRIDHQIKLRGFRIELGEVEATIGHYSAVREVVVVAREDIPGDKRLVAYIVWHKEQPGSIHELQQYMLQHVPEYMVPSAFLELSELPLSPNGKVDRRALPAPVTTRANLREDYVAPRTPAEQVLVDTWSQELGREQIGIHDNFFALGGHSLLAAQVISRLRASIQVTLPLRALFEAPTIAQLSKYIEQLKTRQETDALPPLRPFVRAWQPLSVASSMDGQKVMVVPVSFAQQRLWFMDQLTPGNPAYTIPALMHFTGELHVEALRMSLEAIQQRHEILRSHFALIDGQPQQIIRPAQPFTLKEVDLQAEPEHIRELTTQRLIEAEAQQAFDLTLGPLWRVTIYHLTPQQYVLALFIHHIISDGWTIGIFFKELERLYTSFATGQQPDLPELPIQYADFALWQREALREDRLKEHLSYWKQQLANAPGALELPTDRPRPATPTTRGATHTFPLSRALTEAIQAASRQEEVTPYIILVAAFQLLLHRYTGQDDIVLGSAIADRQLPEVQEVMGLFLNTVALRANLAGNPTLRELLRRVRDTTLDAHAHQDLPFETLVRELQLVRTTGQNALFQVAIQLDPPSSPSTTPWTLTRMAVGTGGSKFDLSLELDDHLEGLIGHFEYSTDLFDAATIERMAEHWQHLLTQIVADPGQHLADISLLTQNESEQLLAQVHTTRRDYPRDKRVHQLFEEQVTRTPESIAVTFADTSYTYRELNARANQLARYLRTLGVGRDTLVGLCLERSLDTIVALLGILKAGGAYLPLDPTYPVERIAFMLEDAQAPVLLTQQALASQLPPHAGHTVYIDRDREQMASNDEKNLDPVIDGEQLAYVIYTSGSTGKPKGVQISQHALVNFLLSMREEPGLNAQDRLLAVTTLSFDIAGLELYLPLVVGARLIIASRDDATSGSALAALLEREQISVMQATPITWRLLLSTGWKGHPALKALCGGEALPLELARQLLSRVGSLYNMYGPTETTIWSTLNKIEPEDQSISVGGPIANTSIYILDAYGQPLPPGIPGELTIGGDGLARGYLRRPELTAERFPMCRIQGKEVRLYRTGDLARLRVDGTLELIGRIDHQVKLRGYRIELGEIESVLARHPAVQQAVTLVREDEPGNQRLVAYILPQPGCVPDTSELRRLAQAHLPAYMVPSVFVVLETLPQTPNGKVDRRALPMPDISAHEGIESYIAPRTAIEQEMAHIWSHVLGREHIGIHDNFFVLGGHSLLAMQVAARVYTNLQTELPLRLFFETPTIAQQAAFLLQAKSGDTSTQLPEIRVAPRQAQADGTVLLPTSLAQRGLWFVDQLDDNTTAYNLQATMRLCQALNLGALQQSLDALVMHHEALRTTFATQHDEPVQVIAPARPIPITIHHLEDLPTEEREAEAHRLVTHEVQRTFDLQHGPLFRASLFHLESEEHLLLLTMHHIIADGWSINLMLRELATLYSAFVHGEIPGLPDVPTQMGDFAAWQRQWLQDDVLSRELDFWKLMLEGAPTLLELPTDRPRPTQPTHKGALYNFTLPPSLSEALKHLSQQEKVSLYMTLTTAFLLLLERYTGQQDILLGTTSAERGLTQIDTMVGYCINTLVLRNDLSGDPSVRELLARVRENVLAAHAHQHMPFDRLVQELQPDRSLGQSPLFQVFLTLDPPLADGASNWDFTQKNVPTGAAMFDLSLELADRPDGIEGLLEYSTDLFDEGTIARMAEHWRRLLESMVAHPEQQARKLPMLSEAEQRQLLLDWNNTHATYPHEGTIQRLFEEQVERTPGALALIDAEGTLTYRDLNARANQLAHFLRHEGIMPEARVGIALERSRTMIVALLAILKAGAAYVPLDPTFPQERLRFMLHDAQVSLLLTQERHINTLPLDSDIHALCLDRDWERIAQERTENPAAEITGESLAYLLYTSGSTGRPKGVLGTHRASLNRFHWMWTQYPFASDEVCAQKTTLNFVDAVWEIFGPLLQGVRLVLFPEAAVKDTQQFLDLLAQHQVSRLVLVPSLLRVLLESQPDLQTRLPHLRHWICSGEALPLDLVRRFQQALLQSKLLNLYGSSEVAADATCYELPPQAERVLIGRPIANMRVYLLDQQRRPVPVSVPGELYLGGDGVARGYHQRPDLTEAVFLADPLRPDSDVRFFKTGDWARYLPDGTLEYLGRVDQQVKVRGMRLELGEIETVLSQHQAIRQAIVVAREEGPSDTRLVAYVVCQPDQQVTQQELRDHLSAALPAYMVPALVVTLDALPLTPNGKVDRRALPKPENEHLDVKGTYVEPQTLMQRQLVDIWEDLLNVRPIGIRDDFFALGGHSLLAARMVAQVQRMSGKSLPLSILFKSPTIERLAESIKSDKRSETRTPVVAVQASGTKRPFFFLHGDWNGKAFYSLKLSQALGPERPFYLLEPYIYTGLDVIPTLEEVATAHIKAMRTLQPEGPYLLGGWCNGALIAYEMARQLQKEGQEVEKLIMMDPGSAPTFSSWLMKGIRNLQPILRLDMKRQDRLFFRTLHAYEYIRLWNYRQRLLKKERETLGTRDPEEVELPHPNFQWVFPPIEKLHENYNSLFCWIASNYTVRPHRGKLAIFWAKEDNAGRRTFWTNLLASKQDVEVYEVEGNHLTSRTRYIHVLADALRTCIGELTKDRTE
ncbi:non-ribosomal peptide synthetase [Ktedonobacter racemifer]|uniref:Amino acid adenylation domain protein n=1 Tax=Ktedonobacter racemifer DSM 44963 TaxID=485913 RepID=D6TQ90_KTERA|nr:non-ribosomal peptide synthetase [Ktedonobacter racemifer]EFH85738.1 amino acid adenylation domain protein [Ktedonobacter racemifer DSM 44963]